MPKRGYHRSRKVLAGETEDRRPVTSDGVPVGVGGVTLKGRWPEMRWALLLWGGGGLQSSWAIREEIRTGKKIQKAPPSSPRIR